MYGFGVKINICISWKFVLLFNLIVIILIVINYTKLHNSYIALNTELCKPEVIIHHY